MSINSIKGNKAFRHGFQDDVESFFYVVLYACLRWLPHAFSGNLVQEMKSFFDDCRESQGMPVGGGYKALNIVFGTFMALCEWRNDHLANWFNEVLLLLRRGLDDRDACAWTARRLHEIWLKSDNNELPTGDRYEHLVLVNNKPVKEVPVPATVSVGLPYSPAPPTLRSVKTAPAETCVPSQSSKGKRSVDAAEHEQLKRPRRSKARYRNPGC